MVDRLERVDAPLRRSLAVLASLVYVAVCAAVVGILLGQGDGVEPAVGVVLAATIAAAGAMAWGAIAWRAPGAWQARVGGWLALLAASIFLISFALVLWVVMLLAAPAAIGRPAEEVTV